MYDVWIKNYKSGNSVITQWTKIFGVPANDDNGFPVSNPIVKSSEDNASSFDFAMEMNSPYYDAFLHLKTLMWVEYDGDVIFYGRALTIDNTSVYQTKRVHGEGALAFMNDTFYEGVTEKDKQKIDWSTYYSRIINNHNALVQARSPEKLIYRGTVTIDGSSTFVPTSEERKYEPSSWTQTGSLINSLVSEFGGHLKLRYNSPSFYLDWYKYYARDLGVNRPTVSVGENIIDLSTASNNVDKIFTWVTPMGDTGSDGKPVYLDGYTYTDKNGTSHTISGKHIPVSIVRDVYTDNQLNDEFHSASEYSSAQDNYHDIYKPQTFASAKTQEELWNYTINFIKNCYFGIASSFTIRAYDMHILDTTKSKILVGDCVNVQYIIMENGVRTTKTKKLVCKSVSYDLFNPDNNSYTFGIPSEILNRTYSEGRGKTGSEQASGGGGGGGGGEDEKNYSYTFTDAYNWIRASNSGPYGGHDNAERFKANGEMSGTVKYYDPEDLPTGETISQHPELIKTANIIGRISDTIFVCHDPAKGLFACNMSTYTAGAVPARHWYTKHSSKVVSTYIPPSAMLSEPTRELITILSDWGIELKTEDEATEFSNKFLIGLGDNIKGLKTQIWDPVSQKVVEPFKAIIGGLGEIGNSIFGFLGLSGGNSKVRVSDDGTEDGTNGAEMDSETFNLGTFLDNILHPKVQLDGGSSQVKAGFDQNGNWNSVMNATITWIDEHGVEHTTDGFMKAKDFAVREVPSFKTKFIAVDQLVADKATIGELQAVTVRVDTLESDTIKTNELSARIANLTKLRTNAIEASNGIVGNYLMAPYIYLGSLGNANLINGAIKEVQVVPVDNTSEYVLQYRTFDNNTWQDAGTFERAASGDAKVRVTWSGGTLHVVPDVVGDDNYVRWFQKNEEDITWDTNYAWVNVPVNALDEQDRVRESNVFSVYIPTTDAVNHGKQAVKLAGTWNAADNRLTITKESSGSNSLSYDISAVANITYSSATHKYHAIAQAKVDDVIHGEADGLDSGTEAYDDGRSSVKLAGNWNAADNRLTITKETSGSNSLSYDISALAAITYNSTTHKYHATAQAKIDDVVHGGADGLDSGTEAWDAGVTSGKNAVGLSISSRDAKVKLNKSSNAVTEVQISQSLGTLDKTAGSRTVSITVGDVANFLSNVISDYKTGWNDAYGKNSVPGASDAYYMNAKWPGSTLSTGQISRQYTLMNDDNNNVKLQDNEGIVCAKFNHGKYTSGVTAGKNACGLTISTSDAKVKLNKSSNAITEAQILLNLGTLTKSSGSRTVSVKVGSVSNFLSQPITDYKTGWDDAVAKRSIPGAGNGENFTAKWPNSTLSTGQDSKTYSLGNDSDNTVKVTDGTNTVAKFSHNKYNGGWNAARGKNVIPGAGTAVSFTAKWPGSTVGTGQDSKTYTLGNDGDNAVKVTDGTNTVAKFSHNKYSAGYNSAKMSGSWNSNNDTLTITKNTNGSTSLSYALSAKAGITYNSSTHKYRASAQAKVDGTVRGAADGVDSGTEAYDAGLSAGKDAIWANVGITYGETDNDCSGYYTNAEAKLIFNAGVTAPGKDTKWMGTNYFGAEAKNIYKKGFAAGWQAALSGSSSYWWVGEVEENGVHYWEAWTPKASAYSSCNGSSQGSSYGEQWARSRVRYYNHAIALRQQNGYAGASKMVMYFKDNNGNYQPAAGGTSMAWYYSATSLGWTGSYHTFGYYS